MALVTSRGPLPSFVRIEADLVSRLALAAIQIAAIGWFSPGRGLPLDDAWIHQVVARTFAETGTLGYAPGQHGAAATSYLWAALLGINFKLLHLEPSLWALILNGVSAIATGQLLYALLLRATPDDRVEGDRPALEAFDWRATSFFATLVACVSPNVLWFVCSGMEAMPFVALSLAAIWAATDRPRVTAGSVGLARGSGRTLPRALVAGIAAGALALLRPEAAPLGGLLAAYTLIRSRSWKRALSIATPWALATLLYVGSNVVKTGHALPSTLAGRRWLWFAMSAGHSRTDRVLDFLDAWGTRLGSYTFDTSLAVVFVLAGIAAYGALRLARSRHLDQDGPKLLLLWALFHAAFYALLLPTPGHGGRYQPLTPLLFVVCLPIGAAFVLCELVRVTGAGPRNVRFAWFAALALAPTAALEAPIAASLREANALAVAHIQATEIGAGNYVAGLPDGAIASFDIGGIGIASRRRILDLGGLSDPATAALLESGRLSSWLEDNHDRWIVLPRSSEPALPVFDDYRSRLHLADNPALELQAMRVFSTPHDKWEPSIRATWNAAEAQAVYEVKYTHAAGPREVGLAPPGERREIADPEALVHRRERIVVESMLATLATWGLPVDIRLTSDETPGAPSGGDACLVRLGFWGVAVDGCASIGSDLVRARAYELAGRYLAIGDLGGALGTIPHALADAERRIDPRFHPPIAPLRYPVPGGSPPASGGASGAGLGIFSAVLLAALLLERAARKSARVSRLARTVGARIATAMGTSSNPAATFVLGSLVVGLTMWPFLGEDRSRDVLRAVARGRGAVEIALARGSGASEERSARAALVEAAGRGDADIVALLLESGARTDAHQADGTLPIHLAARGGHRAALAVLVAAMKERGAANEEAQEAGRRSAALDGTAGPRHRTAIHDAVLAGSLDSVALLLQAGADPNKPDGFGETPLHLLATSDPLRAPAIAGALLAGGADPRRVDRRGFTPLHAAAAAAEDDALVRVLVDPGSGSATRAETTALTPGGETALDVALRYGRDRAAEALLRAGSVISGANAWPPLHDAARMDAIDRIANLVASAADTERRFRGLTALDVAREHGSKRAFALLREHTR
jgi:ankyrin repeat protein